MINVNDYPAPLTGKTVLDFSLFLPGPYCTAILRSYGARVIKVEPPGGDPARTINSLLFNEVNRGKESVVIDLKTPEGLATARALAKQSDAVMDGFRPGTMDRLGLAASDLRAANPKLVYCAISGFGLDGPYRDRPAHDMNCLAIAGYFSVPSQLEHRPTRPQVRLADLVASQEAANATAMALWDAERNGHGRTIDVSMFDCVAHWAAQMVLSTPGIDTAALADLPLVMADSDIFRTRDGRYLALATLEDKFWTQFAKVAKEFEPSLAEERFARRRGRDQDKHDLHALLTNAIGKRTLEEWRNSLEGVETCWAPVYERSEVLSDPHFVDRGLVERSDDGTAVCSRFPSKINGVRADVRDPAPTLGQHTQAVLDSLTD